LFDVIFSCSGFYICRALFAGILLFIKSMSTLFFCSYLVLHGNMQIFYNQSGVYKN
jgi:hypothetical protein